MSGEPYGEPGGAPSSPAPAGVAGFGRFQRKEVDSLVSALLRGLSFESTRNLVATALSDMVGENSVNRAVVKLCIEGEVNLLRVITIAVYGADPLYGRREAVRMCAVHDHQDLIEIHLYTDDGEEICMGLSKGNPRIATGCRPASQIQAGVQGTGGAGGEIAVKL